MDLYDNLSSSDSELDDEPPCIAAGIEEQREDDRTLEIGEYIKGFWRTCASLQHTSAHRLGSLVTARTVPLLCGSIDPIVKSELLDTLLSLQLSPKRCKCILQLVSEAQRQNYCARTRLRCS